MRTEDSLVVRLPAEPGRCVRARGPDGGGLAVELLAAAVVGVGIADDDGGGGPPSWPLALRQGTDPKAGADGAMGGGDTSLAGLKCS